MLLPALISYSPTSLSLLFTSSQVARIMDCAIHKNKANEVLPFHIFIPYLMATLKNDLLNLLELLVVT